MTAADHPLTAVLDDLPENGNLTLNPDGGFTYMPDPDFNGMDSFTYHASNGSVDSNIATAILTIAPVNDEPQFASASINGSDATEDSPYAATLAGSASDVDAGDTLTYSKISGPAWLIVSGNGSLGGTPLNSDVGNNVFTVRATDSAGAFDQATLNLTVNPVEKFGVWMAGYGLNAGATDDSDDDSIPNAIEFVIGGNPASQPDNNFLPTISLVTEDPDNNNSDEDYLLFTYRRTDLAASDEFTEISVEWALDPAGPWTDSVGNPRHRGRHRRRCRGHRNRSGEGLHFPGPRCGKPVVHPPQGRGRRSLIWGDSRNIMWTRLWIAA